MTRSTARPAAVRRSSSTIAEVSTIATGGRDDLPIVLLARLGEHLRGRGAVGGGLEAVEPVEPLVQGGEPAVGGEQLSHVAVQADVARASALLQGGMDGIGHTSHMDVLHPQNASNLQPVFSRDFIRQEGLAWLLRPRRGCISRSGRFRRRRPPARAGRLQSEDEHQRLVHRAQLRRVETTRGTSETLRIDHRGLLDEDTGLAAV
jgi:hypothetical protein